jgi:hypothetical protein
MANAPAPQERTALSEPRVGAYTEKQLSEVRRHHADTPCVITGTHETCRLLATVNEREEALQRVRNDLDGIEEMAKMGAPPEYHNILRWLRAQIDGPKL